MTQDSEAHRNEHQGFIKGREHLDLLTANQLHESTLPCPVTIDTCGYLTIRDGFVPTSNDPFR